MVDALLAAGLAVGFILVVFFIWKRLINLAVRILRSGGRRAEEEDCDVAGFEAAEGERLARLVEKWKN